MRVTVTKLEETTSFEQNSYFEERKRNLDDEAIVTKVQLTSSLHYWVRWILSLQLLAEANMSPSHEVTKNQKLKFRQSSKRTLQKC